MNRNYKYTYKMTQQSCVKRWRYTIQSSKKLTERECIEMIDEVLLVDGAEHETRHAKIKFMGTDSEVNLEINVQGDLKDG